jgi:hypothetical protein
MNRRTFIGIAGVFGTALATRADRALAQKKKKEKEFDFDACAAIDRRRILSAADRYLKEKPVTVTAAHSPRSAGGPHDYFSEADYWWPDPQNPKGPYVQRDGMSNPGNFDDHRQAMRRLSLIVPALTAAWKVTGQPKYAEAAIVHLYAWFVDQDTCMNPNLLYSQAIQGRFTGRGTGIIDTIHLVEVARSAELLAKSLTFAPRMKEVRAWFVEYVQWMNTHEYGIAERDAANNHATCFTMQTAQFSRFTGNEYLLKECRERFKRVFVPKQIAADGRFPEELRRTKPYGYSLFNLEALSACCQMLWTEQEDLWNFTLPDGRGMRLAMAYMVPFIRDKKKWPLPPDVMYDKEWPMRQTSLLFGGIALHEPSYIELWKTLPADSDVDEVIRNFFIRQPVLWV